MKRGVVLLVTVTFIMLLSTSLVSAAWYDFFSDFWDMITGKKILPSPAEAVGYLDPDGDAQVFDDWEKLSVYETNYWSSVDDGARQPDKANMTDYFYLSYRDDEQGDLSLSMTSLTGVGKVSQIKVWVYGKLWAGGELLQVDISKDGSTWVGAQTINYPFGYEWKSVSFSDLNWNQEELDNLQVRIIGGAASSDDAEIDIYALYAEVVYEKVERSAEERSLVAHYKFDSDVKDSSGYGNNGVNSEAVFVSGKIGNALSFDGVDDYVEVLDSNSLDLTNALTISMWVYSVDEDTALLLVKQGDTSSGKYSIYRNSYGTYSFRANEAAGIIYLGSFANNEWHHITFTYDKVNLIAYINGEEVRRNAYTDSILISSGNLYIGKSEGHAFKGRLDELKIWNYALSAEEVKSEYENIICNDTCSSLGYECGNQPICNQSVNCGDCSSGYKCENGKCIEEVNVTCTDSDGGKNYYVKGFMKAGENDAGQWDVCIDDIQLAEYYCEGNEGKKITYSCPYGCVDGACIEKQVNLTHYYLFDSDARDYVGNNHGTLKNGPVFVEGKKGNALKFDGKNDFVALKSMNTLKKEAATLSFWVKAEDTENTGLFSYKSRSSYSHIELWSDRIFAETKSNCNYFSFNNVPKTTEWTFYTIVFDNSKAYLYKNGEFVKETDGYGRDKCGIGNIVYNLLADFEFKFIGVKTYYSPYFKGLIDEIKIWDGALSAAKIREEYGGELSEIKVNASISIATLKDTYDIGEKVALTDPPEESLTSQETTSNQNSGLRDVSILSANQAQIPPGEYLNQETGKKLMVVGGEGMEGEIDYQKNSGEYIIQFKDEPVLVRKVKAEKKIEELDKKIKEADSIIGFIPNIFRRIQKASEEGKVEKLSDYKNKLKEKHKNFLSTKLSKVTGRAVSNEESGTEILGEYTDVFNGIALDISAEEAEELKKDRDIENVYPNMKVEAALMDSVPLINADDVWNTQDDFGVEITGKDVTIAVIDTGVDYTHPDLGGCFGEGCKVIGGYDVYNDDANPIDDHGHGTHVAGIAAGNGVLKGVAPDAEIYAYKVLSSGGSGNFDDVISGIEMAMDPNQDGIFDDHVDVISMSLGGNCWKNYNENCGPDDVVSQAVDNAVDAGVVVVIAAGNSGPGIKSIGTPGTARKAITVGASYKKNYEGEYWEDINPIQDQITSFSSRGPVIGESFGLVKPDIVAPGAIICSARYDKIYPEGEHSYYYPCIDEKHVQLAGTSMATPMAAGAVALLKQAHPNWTPEEIKMALKNTAINLGEDANTQGNGRIDILEAIDVDLVIANIQTGGIIAGTEKQITGTARGDNFINYTLYYKNSDYEFEDWKMICSSTEQVIDSVLCVWDIKNLEEDGNYMLKLVSENNIEKSLGYAYVKVENTRIITPKNIGDAMWPDSAEILPTWKNIIINGTSTGEGFDYYEIKLCYDWKDCLTDTIYLENGGKYPVVQGILGYVDTSKITEPDFYTLTLITHYEDGKKVYDEHLIYIETQLQKGWPRERSLSTSGAFTFAFIDQPTIADINENGKNDLITAYGQFINVVNHEGNSLEGWPVEITTESYYGKCNMQKGPAIGDLDNDGYNEIVIGDNCGNIHVLNHDGSYVFEPKDLGTYLESPTLEDLNRDGDLEIIVGDWWSNLKVLDKNGNYLNGWPKWLEPIEGYPYFNGIWSVVSTVDINADGDKEIIVGSSSCATSGSCSYTNFVNRIWVFNYDGTIVEGWPKDFVGEGKISGIALGDIDFDGETEIIFGLYRGYVYALNSDGSDVNGWPVNATGGKDWAGASNPAIGDIDNDGKADIVFTVDNGGCLYAVGTDGKIIQGFPVCREYGVIYSSLSENPVIGNLNNDNNNEVIPQTGGGWSFRRLALFYAFNSDGTITENFPKYLEDDAFGNVAPVGDLDGDGDNELVVGTWGGVVYVYDLPGKEENNEWPEFHYDEKHTGCYKCDEEVNLRPQSKIVNNENADITGNLTMRIQKSINGTWQDYSEVYNSQVTVPANNLIKLDAIFNSLNVVISEAGTFRVYASLTDSEGNVLKDLEEELLETSWEFDVS